MKIETAVFDFFGVICSEVAPFWLARYVSPAEALAIKAGLVHDADRGEIPEQILFERLGEIAGRSSDQVRQEWNTYVRIDPDVVALVQEVRAHSRVALLTNCPSPFFRAIIERHDLVGLFDVIVVSSEVGVAKPDARAYQRVLEQLPTAAGECLMIDDNPANVEGAQAVGMQALLFTSAAACRDTLRSCGLVS